MEKRAIYRVEFRALEILGFSSFKKKMSKSWISLYHRPWPGPCFEPVLMNFFKKVKIYVLSKIIQSSRNLT